MVYANLDYEKKFWGRGYKLICGVDEVGRGCFAGPVVAGAVIFSPGSKIPVGIADSKLLKPKDRVRLGEEIKQSALAWSVGEVEVDIINKIGIVKATNLAYERAIEKLIRTPDFFLIDAFYIENIDKTIQKPIVKGDMISISIAAASIVAKVYRDNIMERLHEDYPEYGFNKHKGYGTKAHREALGLFGLTGIHRTCFNLEKFCRKEIIK